ncbi:hypothetical protein KM043_013608 [Ampulex compressa]|nr:hypothetical protein KM043_013608 [Ampulex compressa]
MSEVAGATETAQVMMRSTPARGRGREIHESACDSAGESVSDRFLPQCQGGLKTFPKHTGKRELAVKGSFIYRILKMLSRKLTRGMDHEVTMYEGHRRRV